jgi:tripartite-type tricarboxylate transporter receptor subunit TctC
MAPIRRSTAAIAAAALGLAALRDSFMPSLHIERVHRAALLALMLWCAQALSTPAAAQASYPSRPIRIVTPLAAGAASDIALRILADRLSARLRVPVLVQNQPGAAGVIAERAVTNAPADGTTILWAGNNTAIGVSLFKQPVDPRKELRPVVGVSEFAYLLVTSESSPLRTLRQWIAAVKEKPGALTVGTSSPGTTNYLAALLIKSMQNLDFTVVPYRGPSELSVAWLRNEVDAVINAYGGLRSQISAKQIRPLAITSASRDPDLPDVPTMQEAGVPDFVVISWNALYGPRDMPAAAVDILGRATTEILEEREVQAKFREIGFDARPLAAEPLDRRMRSEIERWARVIAEGNLEKQ